MTFDFAAVLVLLTVLSGLIWWVDAAFFASRRNAGRDPEDPAQLPVIVDYAKSFFPVFLIVLLLRSFLFEPFRIPSGSMIPTLLVGDFILVNKFTYGIRLPVINRKVINLGDPQRGDVVVFRYPVDPSTPFIKRVVGIPGDTIEYREKKVYLNGEPLEYEPIGRYLGNSQIGAAMLKENIEGVEHDIILMSPSGGSYNRTWEVPEGHYFVLGDNRDNSKDSRVWNFVPDRNLVGRAFMIWMNWNGGPDFRRIGTKIR